MARHFNLAKMNTATTGTGTMTLTSAVAGFLTFDAAGVTNGQTVRYAIRDGSNSEIGTGVYTTSGATLSRTVFKSTNADAAISLSGSAQVAIVASAEDLTEWGKAVDANGFNLGFDGGTGITDDALNEQLLFTKTASAVNEWTMGNAATGNGPTLQATGGDTNISPVISGKGTGGVILNAANNGVRLNDTDASHKMRLVCGSNLTADRDLTLTPGDAARTLTFSGDATLGTCATVQVFTSSGTWTKPTGCRKVIVWVLGGGGGGGGGDGDTSQAGCGGGGGAGGLAIKLIDVTAISSVTVTVGAAGTGATAGPNIGGAGGTSSFGAHCSATGGFGGQSMSAGTSILPAQAGAGGSGSGGDINNSGAPGARGSRFSGTAPLGGWGGSTMFGGGGRATSTGSAPPTPTGYGGGGGGGASATTTDIAGADGAPGIVIVWEYYA